MVFEYDTNKSLSNKLKHGIDFEEAKKLWQDENLLAIPLEFADECRHAYIGAIQDKMWTAITTHRNSVIRIISVRRSRTNEVFEYEKY